jgi:hypothetical protein
MNTTTEIVRELTEALRWALTRVNHVDVTSPEYSRGVHRLSMPDCEICAKLKSANQALQRGEAHSQNQQTNP